MIPRRLLAALACAALTWAIALTLPDTAFAAEIIQGNTVTIDRGDTIADDVYAFGSTVRVEGTVDGDLIAFSSTVDVDGEVTGDVIVAGSDVRITGEVGGSVRAGSGTLSVSGEVAEDVVAGTGRTSIDREARIGRDLVAGTGELTMDGEVGRNVLAGTGAFALGGSVRGDVRASVATLDVSPDARVGGDLEYTSDSEAEIPDGVVAGEIIRKEPPAAERRDPATAFLLGFLGWIRGLVGMALLALVVTLVFPRFSTASARTILRRPLPSLGIGAALFFGVPVVAVFVFALGILIGGWWIGLMLLALYAIALTVAVVLAAAFLGWWLLGLMKRPDVAPVWAALLGLLALWIVMLVPVLGGLVVFAAMLFGLGAGAIAAWESRRRIAEEEAPAAMV